MKTLIVLGAILFTGVVHAQVTSNAQQSSQSDSVAQGTIQFSQTPEYTHQTIENVSAPVLGAYASSFSQMNCSSTAQAGVAVAGFSLVGGASKDSHTCVMEVAAAETVRQSTVTDSPVIKAKLQEAATAIRCQVSREVWLAYKAAGLDCKGLVPDDLKRTDTQPENYRVQ